MDKISKVLNISTYTGWDYEKYQGPDSERDFLLQVDETGVRTCPLRMEDPEEGALPNSNDFLVAILSDKDVWEGIQRNLPLVPGKGNPSFQSITGGDPDEWDEDISTFHVYRDRDFRVMREIWKDVGGRHNMTESFSWERLCCIFLALQQGYILEYWDRAPGYEKRNLLASRQWYTENTTARYVAK